jgi:NADPH-dependent F420 reductase
MAAELPSNSKPVIAILGGTGKEGPGLALRWALAGYSILIGSRQAEKAKGTAAELNDQLGIDTIQGLENSAAAQAADICVLTVPYEAHQATLETLRADLQGKILVDATARVDFRKPKPPEPPAAAQTAEEILGGQVRVVAAFQNVPASALRRNLGQRLDVDVLVCAEDAEAAQKVIRLAEALGVKAYYAGGLANALVVEGLTSVLISLNKIYGSHSAAIRVTGLEPS